MPTRTRTTTPTKVSTTLCEYCGYELTDSEAHTFDGVTMCEDCLEERTVICDCCGDRIWCEDDYGDSNISLCESCRDNNYTRCDHCDRLIHNDDVYYDDDDTPYCSYCYSHHCSGAIHDYAY